MVRGYVDDTTCSIGRDTDGVSDFLAGLGGQSLGQWWERRRLKSGEYRCALRVLDGEQPGLDQRWSIGKAIVSPGALTFRKLTINVRSLADSHREPTTGEQWGSLGTEFVIFRASTPQARVELGIVRGQEKDVIDRLQLPKL
jgi:hypothetical protein